ncbi:MAG TPA: class I SAM-dependent methyltransferase [Alphaproteobacteria bacterium]|nr:class I SAM-dependent methyltransferase [Alphaproteobacteria bacterium]
MAASPLTLLNNSLARKAQKVADLWVSGRWHDFPFGRSPWAEPQTYRALWEREFQKSYPEIDGFEKKSGYVLDASWFHDLALHTQIVIKNSPLCYQHGRILYAALRRYLDTTENCPALTPNPTILETGTARGFSATILAKALHDHAAGGKILTFDLLPHNTPMFWNCIDDQEGPKTRRALLAPWSDLVDRFIVFIETDSRIGLQKIAASRIGFAFLDGAHTYRDVAFEFETVSAHQKPGDIIVFDDYSPDLFPGLVRAVDEGCQTQGYDKEFIRSDKNRAYVVAKKKG